MSILENDGLLNTRVVIKLKEMRKLDLYLKMRFKMHPLCDFLENRKNSNNECMCECYIYYLHIHPLFGFF